MTLTAAHETDTFHHVFSMSFCMGIFALLASTPVIRVLASSSVLPHSIPMQTYVTFFTQPQNVKRL